MTHRKPMAEILAPAGSIEQLVAAVNNGCDSVYLGLDSFNARMKAPNFTIDNLQGWVDYCHLYGVKVYVALNTSIKNDEFDEAVKLLLQVYKCNADGVIVTDLALMRIAAALPKPFEIVASTQLNAHDGFGAEFLKNCGATTVVCARESSLDEIKSVVATGVKTECFVHGATCVCQSGQCLFSSMVGGNSGNRGLCAQPCRKQYLSNATESKHYLLSARDLCGLDCAKTLHEDGVEVFKIEGRNRRAEYAGITSKAYKKLFENNFTSDDTDRSELAEMYNRSMSSLGYLKGQNSDIIYPFAQNHIGVRVGVVKNRGIAAETELSKGDGLKVFDGKSEWCGAVVTQTGKGFVNAEFDKKVRDGMEVRRTTSVKLCHDVLSAKKKLSIALTFSARTNQQAEITAKCNDVSVSYKSDFVVQQAKSNSTTVEEAVEQLSKTGDSPYTISDIAVDLENVFIAKSQLNSMRRTVLQQLSDGIVAKYNSQFANRLSIEPASVAQVTEQANNASSKHCDNILAVTCYTPEQLKGAQKLAKYLIFRPHVVNLEVLKEVEGINCFVDLPSFSDNQYLYDLFFRSTLGVVCHNVGQVELARRLHLPYIAGSGLNIYNDHVSNEFSDAETFVYSQELTLYEIAQFKNQSGLTFVDGRLVLMKLVHCPYKVAYGCTCANCMAGKPLTYTDELGNRFDFYRRRDARCTFELVNGKKLSVVNKLRNAGRYLIDYDEMVLSHYAKLNAGIIDGYAETVPYTKGRLYSKVN